MERGRVVIVGATEDLAQAQILRAAGYTLTIAPRVPAEAHAAQVILVAGGDRVSGCRAARAIAPKAVVIACMATPDDPTIGLCLAAGADELFLPTESRTVLLARVRMGVAIERLRTREEIERRGAQLIDDVLQLLSGEDSSETMFELATRLAEWSGFSRCCILAHHAEDPLGIHVVSASDDPSLAKLPLDLRKYPEVAASFDAREPVFVGDTATSELLGDKATAAARHGGKSLLVVPLVVERRPVGALFLRSTGGRTAPTDEELRYLRLVARAVAASLRNGRFEVLREQTRRTSRVDHERARRQRAIEQHRDFFESAADGMLVVDERGEVLYVNRLAEQLTGYARSGLSGRVLGEVVASSQQEGLADAIKQAAAGTQLGNFDLDLVTTSGEPLRVSVSMSRLFTDDAAVVMSFRDVTVARALEDELHKTKDFLERLINSTVDAIVACDLHGRIIVFNQGAERLTGYSAADVMENLPVWRLYRDGEARAIMAELRAPDKGGVGRLEPTRREVIAKDGTPVPVLMSASIIYEDGQEVASVGIFSDLRERLSIEQRLAAAQEKLLVTEKQALIADLAGTTAHELNQPLTSVMGYAELLKKRMSVEDPNARAVDIIVREAERMAAIVRKIGKITRYETKAYVGSTTILDLDKSANEG